MGRPRLSFVSSLAVALVACSPSPLATTVPVAPDSADARYLALGDSFTAGTGSTPDQSFPARLVAHWAATSRCPVALTNLGVNGYTTDDLIARELPYLDASSPKPQIVTLAIGANDIVHGSPLDRYRDQVREILAGVVASGVKHIVAIPQPDWSLSPMAAAFGSEPALHAKIVAFNGVLRAETEHVDGVYVDLFPEMEAEAEAHRLASDGLHPSAVAYDAWAVSLAKAVAPPCGASK